MKSLPHFFPFLLLVLAGPVVGCKKDSDTEKGSGAAVGLEGTWRLKERQCYCPPGQVPNEMVKFTATTFIFFKDNRPASSGTYSQTTSASYCGQTIQTPALRFVYNGTSPTLQNPSLTLTDGTLVLDYGLACDAARETYVRVP
jgi:hypothetical protein